MLNAIGSYAIKRRWKPRILVAGLYQQKLRPHKQSTKRKPGVPSPLSRWYNFCLLHVTSLFCVEHTSLLDCLCFRRGKWCRN